MALTLDTGHALYGNLVSLVVVDEGNVLKDLKTPSITFTPHANVTYATGPFGRGVVVTGAANGTGQGVLLSSVIPYGTTGAPNGTVFIAMNAWQANSAQSRASLIHQSAVATNAIPVPNINLSTGGIGAASGSSTPGSWGSIDVRSGAHTVAVTRTGQTSFQVYTDATLELDLTGALGFTGAGRGWDYIGGYPAGGYGWAGYNCHLVATFDKVLSQAEIEGLHDSLTGDNAFAMISSPPTLDMALVTASPTLSLGLAAPGALAFVLVTDSPALALDLESPLPNGSLSFELVTATPTLSLALGTAIGKITSLPLKTRAGSLIASQAGITVWIYDATSGELLATKTGVATNASGVFEVTDFALSGGQQYRLLGSVPSIGHFLYTGTAVAVAA